MLTEAVQQSILRLYFRSRANWARFFRHAGQGRLRFTKALPFFGSTILRISTFELFSVGVIVFFIGGFSPAFGATNRLVPQFELVQETDEFLQPLEAENSAQSITDLKLDWQFGNGTLNARLTPWLRTYAPNAVGGDVRMNQNYFDLKEGWLEIVGDNIDLRVGNQIVSWGSGDAINPTDIWNPSDLIDPFNSVTLPILMAKLSVHPISYQHIILDVIASPVFHSHRLPVFIDRDPNHVRALSITDSRWLIPSPSTLNTSGGVSVPVEYQITGAEIPPDWQTGARLRLMRLADWDFSLSESQTTERMPAFVTKVSGNINSPSLPVVVTLTPVFYRVNTVGFDAVGSISDFGVRFEIAKSDVLGKSPDEVSRSSVWATAGFDRSFFIAKTEIYLNSFFIFKQNSVHKLDSMVIGIPSFEPWDRDLATLLELRFSSKAKLGLRAINSFTNQDAWLHPFVSDQLIDSFKFEIGADFFVGSQSGIFGQYLDNNRVTSELTVNF